MVEMGGSGTRCLRNAPEVAASINLDHQKSCSTSPGCGHRERVCVDRVTLVAIVLEKDSCFKRVPQ